MTDVAAPSSVPPGFRTSTETIDAGDGVNLRAIVVQPGGVGPFPLLVMPSSWAVDDVEYVAAAVKLAQSDYLVVSYTSRGFWNSGGEIDIAGLATVDDVGTVITWATDKYRISDMIGAVGISYGAGTALLAAAKDSRIRAVAAMSTWGSLAESLDPNRTVSSEAVHVLLRAGEATGNPGPAMKEMQKCFNSGQIEPILQMLSERSPTTAVAAINDNNPAVLIANAWEDGIFPPGQVVDFFTQLKRPKRLILAAGDHATAELPGLLGLRNYPWDAVRQWMDLHLRGVGDPPDEVSLKTADGGGWHSYHDWAEATAATTKCFLDEPTAPGPFLPKTGSLVSNAAAADWNYPLAAGISTIADSGHPIVTGLIEAYFGIPPIAWIPFVGRSAAAVWWTKPLSESALLSGSVAVHLTITSTSRTSSLFLYLYDVDEVEVGRLMTHAPFTLADEVPGQAQSIDVKLLPVAWRVRGGHRIALVIDTMDKRYTSASVVGSTVTITSSTANPSYAVLPTALP